MTVPPAPPLLRVNGEKAKTAQTAASPATLCLRGQAIHRALTAARGHVTAFIAGTVLIAI